MERRLRIVKTQDRLKQATDALRGLPAIGLDIETAYWWFGRSAERVSLIQIAAPESSTVQVVWVIDCFALEDLSLLIDVVTGDTVKAIHNASFDVPRLGDKLGLYCANVWCTMTAERRAGVKAKDGLKLADLMRRHFDERLDKQEQASDWSRRPLSEEQLRYAAHDALAALRLYMRQNELGFDGRYDRGAQKGLPATPSIQADLFEQAEDQAETEIDLQLWLERLITSGRSASFLPQAFWLPSDSGGQFITSLHDKAIALSRELRAPLPAVVDDGCTAPPDNQQIQTTLSALYRYIETGARPAESAAERAYYQDLKELKEQSRLYESWHRAAEQHRARCITCALIGKDPQVTECLAYADLKADRAKLEDGVVLGRLMEEDCQTAGNVRNARRS